MSSSNNKAVYTSGPLPRNREVSAQFQSFGASGAPTSIGELRISMVNTRLVQSTFAMVCHLWVLVFATISGMSHDGSLEPVNLPATTQTFDLSPRPSLAVTISGKVKEKTTGSLETAGFVKRSNGRYQYFVGPPTDDAMKAAIKAGCDAKAFAPGNSVNLDGLVLYSIMSRVLYHAFCVLKDIGASLAEDAKLFPYTPIAASDGFKIQEANLLVSLPTAGFFFPYFDGLLLPDHGCTLATFIELFSHLFGKTPSALALALATFGSGWSSLNQTTAGKEYSHMVFCIKLATSCAVPVRPVYLAGVYAGCVFDAGKCMVVVGGQVLKPSTTSELESQIERMQTHDSALAEICAILTSIDKDDDASEDHLVISPTSIKSARQLHYMFKTRTLGPDEQKKLFPLMRKLRFEQKFWDVTNPTHVRQAIAYIVEKKFPDDTVPMNLRLDAVFTKQPIYSVLGAFGTKAPSIRGTGTHIVRRIAPRFLENLDKPGRVTGIPVFAKSHQEAKEDWEGILREYTVFFDHKGADKQGKLRISHLSSLIPFDTEDSKAIMKSLVSLTSSQKRKADDKDEEAPAGKTQEELDQDEKKKRRKVAVYGMLGMTFGPPPAEAGGSGGAMDVDAGDDFFD